MGKRKFQHQGSKRNVKKGSSGNNTSANQNEIGPIVVTAHDVGQKAFIFCNQKFHVLSKKELRNCFYKREVYLNNIPLDPGVKSEMYCVQENDEFIVRRNLITLKQDEIEAIPINIQYNNDHFAVVHKASGQSVSESSYFEDAVCGQISAWMDVAAEASSAPSPTQSSVPHVGDNTRHYSSLSSEKATDTVKSPYGHLTYRLEKSIEGFCLVARTKTDKNLLVQLIQNNSLSLIFTCILTGNHGDVGTVLHLDPQTSAGVSMPTLAVEVVSVTPCRSAQDQSLSLVTVSVSVNVGIGSSGDLAHATTSLDSEVVTTPTDKPTIPDDNNFSSSSNFIIWILSEVTTV